MNCKTLTISIGRQFGCGGRVIGQRLAEELGYDYFDKELLALAAKEIGFEPSVFEEIDEQPQKGIFQSFGDDYILRDFPNCISVFLHADLPDRIKRVCARMPIEQDKARALIERNDKRRATYYNYYSNKTWGRAETYDLCLNVSRLGVEETVAAIIDYVNRMKERL